MEEAAPTPKPISVTKKVGVLHTSSQMLLEIRILALLGLVKSSSKPSTRLYTPVLQATAKEGTMFLAMLLRVKPMDNALFL